MGHLDSDPGVSTSHFWSMQFVDSSFLIMRRVFVSGDNKWRVLVVRWWLDKSKLKTSKNYVVEKIVKDSFYSFLAFSRQNKLLD